MCRESLRGGEGRESRGGGDTRWGGLPRRRRMGRSICKGGGGGVLVLVKIVIACEVRFLHLNAKKSHLTVVIVVVYFVEYLVCVWVLLIGANLEM